MPPPHLPPTSVSTDTCLSTSISTVIRLTTSILKNLQSSPPPSSSSSSSSHQTTAQINPLSLAHQTTSLLAAQTTKLSLLAINAPFTPSALSTILTTFSQSLLPSLATSVQLCPPSTYGTLLSNELRNRVKWLLEAVIAMVEGLPREEEEIGGRKEDVLRRAGVVWEACGRVKDVGEKGVIELAEKKMEGWCELMKDAVLELEHWMEDGGDEEDEDSGGEDGDEDDELIGAKQKVLSPKMRAIALRVIASLKLLVMLFPPLVKRRIKRFPEVLGQTKFEDLPSHEQFTVLEDIVALGEALSNGADELAEALYTEEEEGKVLGKLEGLKDEARKCLDRSRLSWAHGKEDEFTAWYGKFLVRLDEV